MSCPCGSHDTPPLRPDGPRSTDHPTDQATDQATMKSVSRRLVLAGGAAVGAAPFLPGLARAAGAEGDDSIQRDFGFLAPQPAADQHIRPIMFPVLPDPVLGKAAWSDTYLAPRSGGRRHEGQDLMGKKMLKLLACVDGTVAELRHGSSGNSLYIKGDDGWYYCYLHINNDTPGTDDGVNALTHAFAPGLEAGDRVTKGQHVAYLGDSGNAEGSGSHLHFEIRMPNDNMWKASAVNAHYSLTAAEPAVLGGGGGGSTDTAYVTSGPYVPFARAEDFARRQAIDFLGVTPTAAWLADATARLEGGLDADSFILELTRSDAWAKVVPPTIRLYSAYFLRRPDTSGLKYWVGQVRNKVSLDTVSQQFAGSAEFKERYGRLGNAEFVALIYQNVLGRKPDNAGYLHWTYQLDHGKSRGWVMRQMCESAEYVGNTAREVGVIGAFAGLLGRSPSDSDLSSWVDMARANDGALEVLVGHLRTGPEYATRVKAL